MKNKLREELEAMLELRTGDSFTADNVHTLVNGIFAADEGGGFVFVEYDDNAFRYPQTIGKTADSISGLGPADENMIDTIFIMPNKSTNPDATLMIVVDEKDPSTDPKTYQYVYVGNINDLPSDVLTEENIVNIPGIDTDSVISQKGATDLVSEYNVSTNNNNTEYTFSQAVALVPVSLQKGGLTIKYIDSTTHEYAIKRLISSTWNTTESNWQGIDDEPAVGSDNLVKSGGVYKKISQLDQEVDGIDSEPIAYSELYTGYKYYSAGVVGNNISTYYQESGGKSTIYYGVVDIAGKTGKIAFTGLAGIYITLDTIMWAVVDASGIILAVENVQSGGASFSGTIDLDGLVNPAAIYFAHHRDTTSTFTLSKKGLIESVATLEEEVAPLTEQVEGIALQTEENTNDISDIKDSVSDIKEVLQREKTDDVETTYETGYINADGGVSSSQYAKHSNFVPIGSDETFDVFTRSSQGWYAGFYSEANESSCVGVQQYPENPNDEIIIHITTFPENAKYLRVTLNAQSDAARFISHKRIYIDFPKEYYVNQDGTGDFTGLVAALSSLHEDETPKIIYIVGGVYDILAEMGGQSFIDSIPNDVVPSDWPIYSNFVPNNTAIVGDGEATLNFFPSDDTPQEKMAVISPMAFRGSVSLENLTINASNCRYAIHDEAGTVVTGMTKKYKNVKVHKSGGGYTQCFAGGLSSHSTLIFENCLFESTNGIAWYIHENVVGYCSLLFSNCAFIPGGGSAALYLKTDKATGKESVQLNNCVLSGNITLKDSAAKTNRYALLLIKSGNPTITCDSDANPYTPQIIQ